MVVVLKNEQNNTTVYDQIKLISKYRYEYINLD